MNTHELITPLELDSLDVEIPFNYVLIEYQPDLTHTTVGGIIVPVDSRIEADNSNRMGVVIKAPKEFVYYRCTADQRRLGGDPLQREMNSPNWKTTIEVEEGDEVWFNFQESENAYQYKFDGRFFKTIHYQDIILAKRHFRAVKDKNGVLVDHEYEVIMCNGYVLLEEIMETETVLGYSKDVAVQGRGKIAYFGTPNLEYKVPERQYGVDRYRTDPTTPLVKGATAIIFKEAYPHIRYLEDYTQARFENKKYLIAQRWMIGAVIG